MTPEQHTAIKRHLEQELDTLEAEQSSDIQVEYCADENEFASVVTDAHIKIAVQERAWKRMKEIRTALKRMESVDYGECEECGGDIGPARLMARPTASLCVDCQNALERQGAVYAV